jgi:hypothetical protein
VCVVAVLTACCKVIHIAMCEIAATLNSSRQNCISADSDSNVHGNRTVCVCANVSFVMCGCVYMWVCYVCVRNV